MNPMLDVLPYVLTKYSMLQRFRRRNVAFTKYTIKSSPNLHNIWLQLWFVMMLTITEVTVNKLINTLITEYSK